MTYKLLCVLLLYFYLTLMFNYRLLLLRSYAYKKYRVNSNSYIVRHYVPHFIIILVSTLYLWSHSSLHPHMLCQVFYLVLLFYCLYTKSKKPRVCNCTYTHNVPPASGACLPLLYWACMQSFYDVRDLQRLTIVILLDWSIDSLSFMVVQTRLSF